MTDPTNPRREHPSAYFVQDRSNEDEMTRLRLQDQMITTGMGGVLPEQTDPTRFRRVLDVGCGTGGWLIETAKTYPNISLLIGVDVSKKMVDYARSQAEAQGVSDRVEFHVMDSLRMLEFPASFFDLVNQRYGMSYLRTWEWPKLLNEYQRVCRHDGVIRITESDFNVDKRYPALGQLTELFIQAFYQSGHLFTATPDGLTSHLLPLLQQHGLKNLRTQMHAMEFRAGTPEGQLFYEDVRLIYRTIVPFFRRWLRLPDDYEAIYQQMLDEMQQPDFVETAVLLTIWGTKGHY
ncbi:MAG TPA: methyltransferase domain-containing protein [Ktedonosporobacter sp.]|nr:methyltransferase domain-containing protein [Ktedonosporobacter sp.]